MKESSITSKQLLNAVIEELVKVIPNDNIKILEADLQDKEGKVVGMAILVEYVSSDIDDKATELGIENKNNVVFKTQYVWGDDVKKRLNKDWWYENLYDGLLVEVVKSGIISTKFNRLITLPLLKKQLDKEAKENKEGKTTETKDGKEIQFKTKED